MREHGVVAREGNAGEGRCHDSPCHLRDDRGEGRRVRPQCRCLREEGYSREAATAVPACAVLIGTTVLAPRKNGDAAVGNRTVAPSVRRLPSQVAARVAQNGSHGFELLQKPYSVEALAQALEMSISCSRARLRATSGSNDSRAHFS